MPQQIDPIKKAMLEKFLNEHPAWVKTWNFHNPNQPPPVQWDETKGEWIWLTRKLRRKLKRRSSLAPKTIKSSSFPPASSHHGPSQDNETPRLPKGVADERAG